MRNLRRPRSDLDPRFRAPFKPRASKSPASALPLNLPESQKFLLTGMNLDPIHINSYSGAYDKLDGDGRDDGKYDYVAITDISDMVTRFPNPNPYPNLWHYQSLTSWQSHTRFVRLPPDLPPGWSIDNPNNPLLQPGHDWSFVLVENPELDFEHGDPAEPVSFPVRIVGSGTVKTMAVDPTRRYAYVLASDQGQEVIAENATLLDGGFHVPHLYVLDLWSGDLTDQTWINTHLSSVVAQRYRLNKVVYAEFQEYTPGGPNVWGGTCVNSTIGGFPLSGGGATGPTRVSGASLASIGSYYPGEYQLDPTARVAMKCVYNPFMTGPGSHPARLYIGTTGKRQGSTTTAVGTPENGQAYLTPQVGALIVLSLGDPAAGGYDGVPGYLRTVTLPQVYPPEPSTYNPYTVSGLDVVRPERSWIASIDTAPRNVLLVNAANTRSIDDLVIETDRLVVVQDP